jgi:hypothetical protein
VSLFGLVMEQSTPVMLIGNSHGGVVSEGGICL